MENDKLFFKVWRNIFINVIIFKFIRYFKIYNKIKLNRIEDIRDFPKRHFFKSIIYDGTDELISGGDFPKGVHTIEIKYDTYLCKQPIESQISYGLKKFIFPIYNNKITRLFLFPSSVETVKNATFLKSNKFGQNGSDKLPERKIIIPNNIKSLSIFRCPNHKLSKWLSIPTSLTSLDLGPFWYNGNRVLEPNDLPNHIIELSMYLITPVFTIKKNCLPFQLETLTLTKNILFGFENDIENEIIFQSNCFPSTIRKLEINHGVPKFIFPINFFENITWLRLNYYQTNKSTLTKDMLPPNLITLILIVTKTTISSNVLPKSITYLKLQDYNWDAINNFQLEDSNFFPSSLKKLILNCKINRPIKHIDIPNAIEYLKFGFIYNKPITIQSILIPTSVKKLTINCNCVIESGVLPKSIKYLKFGQCYGYQFISNSIVPESVEILVIKSNQSIHKGFIPHSLKVLKLIGNYDKPINFQLPITIEKLIIGNSFNQSLNETLLPQSITF
ncbi:hypothetical protein ACTFIV_006890 [Dictyostelium citrinum]